MLFENIHIDINSRHIPQLSQKMLQGPFISAVHLKYVGNVSPPVVSRHYQAQCSVYHTFSHEGDC